MRPKSAFSGLLRLAAKPGPMAVVSMPVVPMAVVLMAALCRPLHSAYSSEAKSEDIISLEHTATQTNYMVNAGTQADCARERIEEKS